jgi:hypothetical protein
MNTVVFDSSVGDDAMRRDLYNGQVYVFAPRPSSAEFCDFARGMIERAFAPYDPRDAQHVLPVEQFVAILAELKPKFIHHPRCKDLIQAMLADWRCDLGETYFDVPRLRSMAAGDYLRSGIAYAFHPHRDTWYSAPPCQINWWLPVYPIASDSTMAVHPRYWSEAVPNGSRCYNYDEWNRTGRKTAAQHVKTDTRPQPRPEIPIDPASELRLVCPAGGCMLFSAAHLHSTVPNTSGRTRFSIDFRTVHRGDVLAGRGAPNVDSACTGTTLRDYLRGTDLTPFPGDVVARFDGPQSQGSGASGASLVPGEPSRAVRA